MTNRLMIITTFVLLISAIIALPAYPNESIKDSPRPGEVISSRVDRIMSIAEDNPEQPRSYHGQVVRWKGMLRKISGKKGSGFLLNVGKNLDVRVKTRPDFKFPNGRDNVPAEIEGRIVEDKGIFSHLEMIDIKIKIVEKKQLAGKNRRISGGYGRRGTRISFKEAPPLDIPAEKLVDRLECWISTFRNGLSRSQNRSIARWIVSFSKLHGVDWRLSSSLIAAESAYRVRAVSSAGARGLGQLMPGTAKALGVSDSFDPRQNIEGSIKYISGILREWKGYDDRVSRALAGYNAGPHRVRQYNGIPPYRETIDYIKSIKKYYGELQLDENTCFYNTPIGGGRACPLNHHRAKSKSKISALR